MQAQTTRTLNSNLHKVAGGLLISAALIAGAIGLTTIGGLEIPGIGSNNEAASVVIPIEEDSSLPDVFHRPTDNRSGEGFPLSLETTSIPIDRISHDRQLAAPQGEGYPLAREIPAIVAQPAGGLTQTRQLDAPQGEGFPLIELQQSATLFNPQGEGLISGNGQ